MDYSISNIGRAYIAGMRPVLNKRALFSDTTSNFVTPAEPTAYDIVTISFRTAKYNADQVILHEKNAKYTMTKARSDAEFDYYETQIQLDNEVISYYFEIHVGNVKIYYDNRGVVRNLNEYYNFRIIPGFRTPDWCKGAVMYQIYTDRFCNGDTSNDVESGEYMYIGEPVQKIDDWYQNPSSMDVRNFYGGDLQGVINKLDYLQNLGVEVIYFNPLFVSPSNHGYDAQDYDNIDPHLGKIVEDGGEVLRPDQRENKYASKYLARVTNQKNLDASNALFAELVEKAHARGMKVILDGVFNHCGSFNKWLDREQIYENADGYAKGAYIEKESPYHNWFKFYDENKWPYNYTYDGWWGNDTLPKLNYEGSRELYDYILRVGAKWVSPPYNADGWRLDVAADLGHSPEFNHQFWKDFRRAVKQANPNAVILAEHYGSPYDWLRGDEWDTVMNYDAFMEPVTWFLTGMQKHSDDFRNDQLNNASNFWGAMKHHNSAFTMPSLFTSMNELSNHDHSRFLTRTNHKVGRVANLGSHAAEEGIDKAVMREAVLLQMTWTGAPTIYYGDEAGLCGFTDPDDRRTYPWGREDQELIDFHRKMIGYRKAFSELKTGSIKDLGEDYGYIAYGRFDKNGQSIIAINNTDNEITKDIRSWGLGVPKNGAEMKGVIRTTRDGFEDYNETFTTNMGVIVVTLPPKSAVLIRREIP
ncbi:MAG: glycoside hydrolase family 13 protein [Lachnospiraceae bacterium]|nr:glycoside hydrolase family 13 protein [Lachnospiraceae bacterium]